MRPRTTILITVVLAAAVVVGVIVTPVAMSVYHIWSSWRQTRAEQRELLHKTDLAALANACCDVCRNRLSFGKEMAGFARIDSDDPRLPAVIKALTPGHKCIWAYPDGVDIELGAHDGRYGFQYFTNTDSSATQPATGQHREMLKDMVPSKQVAQGLWFYTQFGLPKDQ